jgi:hypothetical protein
MQGLGIASRKAADSAVGQRTQSLSQIAHASPRHLSRRKHIGVNDGDEN